MANPEHLARLKEGVEAWNQLRQQYPYPQVIPDLMDADLAGAELNGINLDGAYMRGANLTQAKLEGASLWKAEFPQATLAGANLSEANLNHANLKGADFRAADLSGAQMNWANLTEAQGQEAQLAGVFLREAILRDADLSKADLTGAYLRYANLSGTQLVGADLTAADLEGASLVGTNLEGAILTYGWVYGISAWDVKLDGAVQSNLTITPKGQPVIEVDNLKVAQFIYLLLNNREIRGVIDTITSKVVLILGRFTPERIAILEAIREELRKRDYLPVLFDFEKPDSRDLTETVSTLAHMARFVIADITDARSIPQELMAIVPNLPSLPVQPILLASQQEYGMFEHFKRYPWVLEAVLYDDQAALLAELREKVIEPAERLANAAVSSSRKPLQK